MRHIVSTAMVAIVVSLATVTAVSALAQEPAVAPAAVSPINADRVDGRHAVGAGARIAKRAGKLVATNAEGYLPANILEEAPVTGLKLTRVATGQVVNPGGKTIINVPCPAGTKVTGGGFSSSSILDTLFVTQSR